uniref:Auxilin-like protein 1 n=1 Tax=Ananas comosus var. bracteatus TaxID=296719 RepID=A0A6V7PTS5_ANACO|nr:unnamed protein product [Ananas comosus var. bracteatus]
MEEPPPSSRHPRRSKKASAAGGGGGGGGGAAKSAYDDVFGGPPRFAVPFSGRPDDYSEIFGGVATSCSIPFLDLPPAIAGAGAGGGGGGVDYGEIFGGGAAVDFGDFAVPYEELFGEGTREEEIASSNGRAWNKEELGQQDTESFVFHPEYPTGDNLPYLEEDGLSSHSYHSDEGVNQVKISYNKRSQEQIQDSVAIATRAVDSLHNTQPDNPPNISNGSMIHGKYDSSDSTKSKGSDQKGDQKQNGDANPKQHKRSSSNHSTSSGDVLSPDAPFLSVSDINLRTQPLSVPPPSRPPPKLLNNTEQPKLKRDAYSVKLMPKASSAGAFSKSHSLPPKVDSPYFFDVEVDASSAAAASAAAMKEAMEFAQAKLKSAKELMERKRDNFEIRKKKGQCGDIKSRESQESQTAEEEEVFKTVLSLKKKVKEDKKMSDFSFVEKHEVIGSKESHVLSTDRSQRTMQRSASGPSQFSKLENSGNWKSDDQFYELINNELKHNTNTEVSQPEDNANKEKAATEIRKDKESKSVTAEIGHQMEKNIESSGLEVKEIPKGVSEAYGQSENIEVVEQVNNTHIEQDVRLGKVQENHESEKKVEELHASENAPDKVEEIMEMPNAISETSVHKENANKLQEFNDSRVVDNAILGTAQGTHHYGEDEKEPCSGQISPTSEAFTGDWKLQNLSRYVRRTQVNWKFQRRLV